MYLYTYIDVLRQYTKYLLSFCSLLSLYHNCPYRYDHFQLLHFLPLTDFNFFVCAPIRLENILGKFLACQFIFSVRPSLSELDTSHQQSICFEPYRLGAFKILSCISLDFAFLISSYSQGTIQEWRQGYIENYSKFVLIC